MRAHMHTNRHVNYRVNKIRQVFVLACARLLAMPVPPERSPGAKPVLEPDFLALCLAPRRVAYRHFDDGIAARQKLGGDLVIELEARSDEIEPLDCRLRGGSGCWTAITR